MVGNLKVQPLVSASPRLSTRIVVLDGSARRDSEPLIAHTADYLGRFGIGLERVRVGRQPRLPYEDYSVLIATSHFPSELRNRVDCYGKTQSNMPSRPVTLDWLQQAGLPTMRWSRAADRHELAGLFERWQADAILLKPSDTLGGEFVSLFTRDRVQDIEWNSERDLFCPEVNRNDGDIYKLEMFGGVQLLGWRSRVRPARSRMSDGLIRGLYGAYGIRELVDWPEPIVDAARHFGRFALDQGFGHISLDFMRNPADEFEAIEVNLGNIALWWTTQFKPFRRRYARAVHQMLVERHGASPTPANAAVRIGNWIAGTLRKPKQLVREFQAARFRREHSAELEEQYAAWPRQDKRG